MLIKCLETWCVEKVEMKRQYRIMIETTNICNAKCDFCANPNLKRKKMVMSDEIFNLIISKIKNEEIVVEKLILHLNGEPFTDRKLIDRIKRLKQEFPNAPIWFTTNFNLPNREQIDELIISGVDTITISINAIEKNKYEEIMGIEYEKTIKNVEYVLKKNKELGMPINVRVSIVDTGNSHIVRQFQDKYKGLAEVRVIRVGNWGGHENENRIVHESIDIKSCDDLNNQICFLSNGEFAICSFDAEGMVGINIKDAGILDTFNSGEYAKLRRKLKTSGKKDSICDTCSFTCR